jgi:hypothetical protein
LTHPASGMCSSVLKKGRGLLLLFLYTNVFVSTW